MIVDTRPGETNVELLELEALWEAPAVEPESKPRLIEPLARFFAERGWRLLSIAWPVVLVSLFLAPEPQQGEPAIPWYAWTLFALFSVALVGMLAASLGSFGSPLMWSLGAGLLGLALGVGCLATSHHAGGWAAYEIGAFSALTLGSVAALAARRSTR
jgi:hypothetical protein